MWKWHGSLYLGAAHGVAGIVHQLLSIPGTKPDSASTKQLLQAANYLMTKAFPSGNYPTSDEPDKEDKLVHWCHGAPAACLLFVKCWEVTQDQKYLTAAQRADDVVWDRGLLKKGVGLCHGIAGNGYCHLALYRATKDEKYLSRAWAFCDFSLGQYQQELWSAPDDPYSLMNGIGGAIAYYQDLLSPEQSSFPAFDLF